MADKDTMNGLFHMLLSQYPSLMLKGCFSFVSFLFASHKNCYLKGVFVNQVLCLKWLMSFS
jgi:hypothetical protein